MLCEVLQDINETAMEAAFLGSVDSKMLVASNMAKLRLDFRRKERVL